MTQQPRNEQQTKHEDKHEIPSELVDLVEAIQNLPSPARDQVEAALERVVDSTRRRRRILSLVQDALSQLRLDMKYLMFDLEATRRERDDYPASTRRGLLRANPDTHGILGTDRDPPPPPTAPLQRHAVAGQFF